MLKVARSPKEAPTDERVNVPPLTASDHTDLPTLAAKLCQIWEQTTHHLTSTVFNPILHEISNCGGVS